MSRKISFVSGSLQGGGAERVAATLCNYWSADRKYAVSLITGDAPENDFYHLSTAVNRMTFLFDYSPKSLCSSLIEQVSRYVSVSRVLRKADADVYILSTTEISIRVLCNLLLSKKPIIVCEHNNYYALSSRLKRIVRKLLYKKASRLLVLTDRDRKKYIEMGFSRDKVQVMENPLGLPYPENFMLPTVKKKLLAVGRLTDQKAFHRLIDIVHNFLPDYQLDIVGTGPKFDALRKQIREYGANNITLLGVKNNMQEVYVEYDALLMTSIYEGLPMVINEANAYGLPVIAYDCPTGPAEMISDGVNGYVVTEGDEAMFAERVNLALKNDDTLRAMACSSREAAKKLSVEQIARKWDTLISGL